MFLLLINLETLNADPAGTLWHLATQEYFNPTVLWQVFYSDEQRAI